MNNVAIDTAAIIAVVLDEPERERLIEVTSGADLIAPASVHWEIGNAFSAMFKRKRITLGQAETAIRAYMKIPIRFMDISMEEAIELSHKYGIYAYDAYIIVCAKMHRVPLLTLDTMLKDIAKKERTNIVEV